MRQRRRILLLILLLLIAAGLGLYAAAQRYLPGLVREKLVAGLAEAAQRRVTCGTVTLELWRGIVIRDLRVYDKTPTERALLSVDEVSAAFLLLPWGKERKLLLPSVRLYGARLDLVRDSDAELNIQDIIDRPRPPGADIRPIIKSLTITDSEVVLRDEMRTPPSTTVVRLAEGRARASWNKVFIDAKTEVSFNNIKVPVACHGNYAYKEDRWDLRLTSGEIDPKPFLPHLPKLPFTWKEGLIRRLKIDTTLREETLTVKPSFALTGVSAARKHVDLRDVTLAVEAAYTTPLSDWATGQIEGRCLLKEGTFHIDGPLKADGRLTKYTGLFSRKNELLEATFTGTAVTPRLVIQDAIAKDVRADIRTRFTQTRSEDNALLPPVPFTQASVTASEVVGLPRIHSAQDVAAEIAYADGALTFSPCRAKVRGQDVAGEGAIRDGKLAFSLDGAFPLADITRFLSEERPLPEHEISGTAQTFITFDRTLAAGQETRIKGTATIHDVWLHLKERDKTFSAETGRVSFDIPGQSLEWDFSDISYEDALYATNGTLTDFETPRIVLELEGPHMSVRADVVRDAPQLTFKACSGRWHDSTFRFTGTWDEKEETVDVEGEMVVELADLEKLLETAPPALKKMTAEGPLRVTARLRGPLKKPVLWTLRAETTGEAVRLNGYYIEDVAVAYEQAERKGVVKDATFTAYKGTGILKGRLDFAEEGTTFALRGSIDYLDLERLKVDTPLRGRTFFGTLSVNVAAQGALADPKTISGGGHLTIVNGNVWEFNPLRGLGSFLFVPQFSKIVFTTAEGDYYLREGYIETSNLTLKGREMNLLIEGKMGFEGEIDALVYTQAPLGPGEKFKVFTEVSKALSKTTGLTVIRVTGTVKEPKYKLQTIGGNIIKKFTDLFSGLF